MGEVAPENVYSDRSFSYLSEVRRLEAEEWIRSSTPREFNRDFVGEENFAKAMVRLQEGMIAVSEISNDSKEQALQSLTEEIRIKFQVLLTEEEAEAVLNATLLHGDKFFKLGNKLLSQLHLTGVVKFPSVDQKFMSESNATSLIKSQMIELVNDFIIFNFDQNRTPTPSLTAQYPDLFGFLQNIESNQSLLHTNDSFLKIEDLIESMDENISSSALDLRNDLVSDLRNFLIKGLKMRSIDRQATTTAQERAITDMEPIVISVQEGEIILRRGEKVTAADLEKYQEYLDHALKDSVLLPKRIFVTLVTLLLVWFM